MRVGSPPSLVRTSVQVTSEMRFSLSGGAPGTPSACITPPAAQTLHRLTVSGGFTVLDAQQRRLRNRAMELGFTDLRAYLVARCQQQGLTELAQELDTTTTVIRGTLNHVGLTPPPQPELSAQGRRRSTDQRLTAQAAQLGFPDLETYLTDRIIGQQWPLARVATELGTHLRTVRRLLDHYQIRRTRQTAAQQEVRARARGAQAMVWQAQRQARLAQLGFTDLASYLHCRVIEEGWSIRRIRAELRVGRAWLVGQIDQFGLRRESERHHARSASRAPSRQRPDGASPRP